MLTGVPRDDALRLTSLDVRAIPAYKELLVEYAAALLEALGIPWNPPEVVGRFRDKFALKEYIRTVDPSVRMNASRMVTDADQVMAAAVSEEFSRFVLKPVGGLGNKDVLLCPDGADESTIADYFRDAVGPGGSCVMEEFLTGEEYYVDGQVDDARQVTPVAIQKYLRGTVGDRTNIALEHETIRPDDPVFDAIFTYAREVIAATGLRRSPFHMEIMVDDRGPCMVECGARLVGWSAAVEDSADHGPQLDVVQVAGHYWLSPQHLDIPLDFEHYLSRYALAPDGTFWLATPQRGFGLQFGGQHFALIRARPQSGEWHFAGSPLIDGQTIDSVVIAGDGSVWANLRYDYTVYRCE